MQTNQQIRGFLITAGRVTAFRWVPGRGDVTPSADAGRLVASVPVPTTALLNPFLHRTVADGTPVDVFVFLGGGHQYSLGPHRVREWCNTQAVLERITSVPVLNTLSDCWSHWDLDWTNDQIQFPLPDEAPFVPDFVLHNAFD